MNVLLINPSTGFQPSMPFMPLGLLSIASYAKSRGWHVRVYDRNTDKTPLEKVIWEFRPDAVGISAISRRSVNDGIAVSEHFQDAGIPVIWGGHMATIAPELVLKEGAADYVVMGEGEITFHELLRAIEQKEDVAQIKGLVYKDAAGTICRTPERTFANLAEFPVTDWSLVDPRSYFAPHYRCAKMTFVYCSKGCPYRCAFCYNKGYHRCQYRKRPVAHVVEEVKALAAYGMDGVEFADELFGANKKDLYELCEHLRELDPQIAWGFQTRVGHLSREDYRTMYDAGCRWVFFGIESGSPEMLRRIHKEINLEKIDLDFQYCKELGITIMNAFIVGFPDETEEQLRDTVRLILRLDADLCAMSMFYPNPGSELFDYLLEQGRVTPLTSLRQDDNFFPTTGLAANYSAVPTRDLHVIQGFFNWRNFFRKGISKDKTKYRFAQKTIISSIRQIFGQGFVHMWKYIIYSAKLFLSIAWYRFAYPGIRKKYGLYERN